MDWGLVAFVREENKVVVVVLVSPIVSEMALGEKDKKFF